MKPHKNLLGAPKTPDSRRLSCTTEQTLSCEPHLQKITVLCISLSWPCLHELVSITMYFDCMHGVYMYSSQKVR